MRRKRRVSVGSITDAHYTPTLDRLFRFAEQTFKAGHRGRDPLQFCRSCGARHPLDALCTNVQDSHAPERNGVYSGTARVRTLPMGMTGADLRRAMKAPARPRRVAIGQFYLHPDGSIWLVVSLTQHGATLRCGTGDQYKVKASALLTGRKWRFAGEAHDENTPLNPFAGGA